jgi:hypothetical protein
MLEGPTEMGRNSYDKSKSFPFNNGSKCFLVVDPHTLLETTSDETDFIPNSNTVETRFGSENPADCDGFLANRERRKCPGLIGLKIIVFGLHGRLPIGTKQTSLNRRFSSSAWESVLYTMQIMGVESSQAAA